MNENVTETGNIKGLNLTETRIISSLNWLFFLMFYGWKICVDYNKSFFSEKAMHMF